MTAPEDEPMRITLRDVYNAVTGLTTTVGEMKTTVDLQALAASNDHDKVVDHEARIRFLERWAWAIPASALTAIAAVVAALVK